MSQYFRQTAWTNLAEIGVCHPSNHHWPSSTEEVIQLINVVRSNGGHCRIAGGGKSPNACTFTDEHLIHMDKMNRIIAIDAEACSITCQAGVIMEDLMKVLDASGLMIRCVPSFIRTTVGGCIATATHSSGRHCHSLSEYVTRLVLVDGTGALQTLTAADDEPMLRVAACHLGMLGAVVELTLKVEKRSAWHLHSQPLSMADAAEAALVRRKVQENDYYRWWWVPHTNCCYESYGNLMTEDCTKTPPDTKSTADMPVLSSTAADAAANGRTIVHDILEWSLWVCSYIPFLQPLLNRAYAAAFYSAPADMKGSSMKCLTFDCLFKQWANEWAIDASRATEAFVRLQQLTKTEGWRLHFPVEFRFSAADTTVLSPSVGRLTCWVGLVMYRPCGAEAPDTQRCYEGFSRLMESLGGRPHWAKTYDWGRDQMEAAYGTGWTSFLELRAKLDPDNIFVNAWFSHFMSEGRHSSTVFPG